MTDNIVPLYNDVVEQPLRYQMLDSVAQSLDQAPEEPVAIVYVIITKDFTSDIVGRHNHDEMPAATVMAHAHARLGAAVMRMFGLE